MKRSIVISGIVALAALTLAACSTSLITPAATPTEADPTAPPYVTPHPTPTGSANASGKTKKDKWGKTASGIPGTSGDTQLKDLPAIPADFPAAIPIPAGKVDKVSTNSKSTLWTVKVVVPSADLRKNYTAERNKFQASGFTAFDVSTGKFIPLSQFPLSDTETAIMVQGKGYNVMMSTFDTTSAGGSITMTIWPTK